MRTEQEVAKLLTRFEQANQVFDVTSRGAPLWQLNRFMVSMKLQGLDLKSSALRGTSFACAIWEGLKVWKLLKIKGTKYLCFTYHSGTRVKEGKSYKDIWFDDLLESVSGGAKLTQLNTSGFEVQLRSALHPPVYDLTLVLGFFSFLAKLLPPAHAVEAGKAFSREVERGLGIRITPEAFTGNISRFFWHARFYSWLLWWAAPKNVLVVDTGEFALLWAARKYGIRSVELQHGIFTRNHPHSLPTFAKSQAILIPDVLAAYGDYWVKELKETRLGTNGRIQAVGCGIIDHISSKIQSHEKFQILLTTQGLSTSELISFMGQFLTLTSMDFSLVVKLHPSYDRNQSGYQELLNDKRVKIISGKEGMGTYELLALSDLHLSISSACHYDALALGIPTIVLKLPGYEVMRDLMETEGIPSVLTAKELQQIIQNQDYNRTIRREYYCRPGFTKNMADLLA